MEKVRVQTAQNVAIDFEVAGIGDRIIAAIIDYTLLAGYLLAVALINLGVRSTAFVIVMMLPAALYFLLCEILLDGQSIGKQARKIKVIRLDGTPPRLGDYLLRWLLRVVDVTLTLGNVAIVTMLVNGRGQRLGDLAAATTVVRARSRTALNLVAPPEPPEDYRTTFMDVEMVDEDDIRLAHEVMHALHYEGRTASSERLAEDMKTILERQMGLRSDLPAHAFLRAVLRDYRAHVTRPRRE